MNLRVFKVKCFEGGKRHPKQERISISESIPNIPDKYNYVIEDRNYRYQNPLDQALAYLEEIGIHVVGYNIQPDGCSGYILSDSIGKGEKSLRGDVIDIVSSDILGCKARKNT